MSYRSLALILISILVLGETGLALWRYLPIPVSTASVFSFPPAAVNFGKPGKFAKAIDMYGVDRGAEWKSTSPDGPRLTVFYFEWDEIKMGPKLELVEHSPGRCNVAAGFKLQEIFTPRTFEDPGQPPLVFDATHFTDPSGRSVYMFKLAWIQGLGSRELREGARRLDRAGNAFLRHQGAARVLQAGVFEAHDADHAWQTFRTQVLDHLEW